METMNFNIDMAKESLKDGVLGGKLPELSPRQRDVLGFMYNYYSEHKRSPTQALIADMLGSRSRTAAAMHVNAMEKKGFIVKINGKPRITEAGLEALGVEEDAPVQKDLLG